MHTVVLWVLISFSPNPQNLGMFKDSVDCTKAKADYSHGRSIDAEDLTCRPQRRVIIDCEGERRI